MILPRVLTDYVRAARGIAPKDRRRDLSLYEHMLHGTAAVRRRPVYDRYLRRKHHMPLKPPTEAEKRDAIAILKDTWEDDLTEEALRILDEAGDGTLA